MLDWLGLAVLSVVPLSFFFWKTYFCQRLDWRFLFSLMGLFVSIGMLGYCVNGVLALEEYHIMHDTDALSHADEVIPAP